MSSIATHPPISKSVVELVAEAEGVDPVGIEVPLYEVVDPDALEALFRPRSRSGAAGQVVFEYCGHTVVVTSDGLVELPDEDGHDDVRRSVWSPAERDSGPTKSY